MLILAIDPGSEFSAYCLYDTNKSYPIQFDKLPNEELLSLLQSKPLFYDQLVVEMIKSYGGVLGDSVINTCVFIGRIIQVAQRPYRLVPRKTVVSVLCHSGRAGDKEIRSVLLDRFKGLKLPNTDVRSALALALAFEELMDEEVKKICL